MPENTNSMLSTLRKLRQMKDPKGYIQSLKTEKEEDAEVIAYLSFLTEQAEERVEVLSDELEVRKRIELFYLSLILLGLILSHI